MRQDEVIQVLQTENVKKLKEKTTMQVRNYSKRVNGSMKTPFQFLSLW